MYLQFRFRKATSFDFHKCNSYLNYTHSDSANIKVLIFSSYGNCMPV